LGELTPQITFAKQRLHTVRAALTELVPFPTTATVSNAELFLLFFFTQASYTQLQI